MSSKPKTIHIDSDDVMTSTSIVSTALAIIPPVVHAERGAPDIDDAFLTKYRAAIRAKFSSGAKFVELIATLKLTADDVDKIEKLRVVFYDTWLELIFQARGDTPGAARKRREDLTNIKGGYRNYPDMERAAYGATKTAWVDVRERADLKSAPKKREAKPGEGASKGGEDANPDHVISPSNIKDFDTLYSEVIKVSQLLDNLGNAGQLAKLKTKGLTTALHDAAKGLRVAANAAREEAASK